MAKLRSPILLLLSTAVACGLAIGGAPVSAANPPPRYAAERIALPSAKVIAPVALNDQGQALMGESSCADCPRTYYLWRAGTALQLAPPAGASYFEPVAIGPSASIAAVAQYGSGPQPVARSYIGTAASASVAWQPLLDPAGNPDGVEAFAMDSSGDILGESTGQPASYFEWLSGQTIAKSLDPPVPSGDAYTVDALDGAGDLAGT